MLRNSVCLLQIPKPRLSAKQLLQHKIKQKNVTQSKSYKKTPPTLQKTINRRQ